MTPKRNRSPRSGWRTISMCKMLNGINWFLIVMAGFGVLSLCLSGCITLATALQGRAKIKLIQDHYEHEERKKH